MDNGKTPRRILSVNDMNVKRIPNLRRSGTSDLTGESSSDDGIGLITCKMRYSELVTVAGVSDIPELFSIALEEFPPYAPIPWARKLSIPKPRAMAIVSLSAPHKLIIVTADFCVLLGYTEQTEICGRALKTIFGPRTDLNTIASGMQSCANIECAGCTAALYNRNGESLDVTMSFSPYLSDKETLAGCLLELTPSPI